MSNQQTSGAVLVYVAEQVEFDKLEELVLGTTWAYGESEVRSVLTFSDVLPLAEYPSGRAFSASYEVRWDGRHNGTYAVEVLTDVPWHDELFALVREFTERGDEYPLLLWGEYAGHTEDGRGIWAEARIPRPLFYPLEEASTYACLLACDLYEHSRVVTTRWLGVAGG